MKKYSITSGGSFLVLFINDLINIFSEKNAWFLYFGVIVIIVLITEFMFYKGIITKNWWKKFIPFYILIIIIRNTLRTKYSVKPLTLYFVTLIIMVIVFILLLIKYLKKKRTESVINS